MLLSYDAERGLFVAKCKYEERLIPAKAGFTWNTELKRWSTHDRQIASALVQYADDSVKKVLSASADSAKWSLEASRATECDIEIPTPEGLTLLPYQKAGVAYALMHKDTLIADDMGLGKAQPLWSKVLTPTGWRCIGDLNSGDSILGSDGAEYSVTGVYDRGSLPVYRVEMSDGSATHCSLDHLWTVSCNNWQRYPDRAWRTLPLWMLINEGLDLCGGSKFRVPLPFSPKWPERLLPIDPYTLGVLLGDGSFTQKSITFASADAEIVAHLEAALPQTLRISPAGRYQFRITSGRKVKGSNLYLNSLRSLGLMGHGSDTKFVPPEYLYSPTPDRQSLLQGLLDTDGYVACDGTVQFSSNSERLLDCVRHLVWSLGGSARKSEKISASGKRHFITTINVPDGILPFRLARKADRYKPKEKYRPTKLLRGISYVGRMPVRCISTSTPDQLYITDDFIVTHNTVQGISVANATTDLRSTLIICPASLKTNWAREWRRWSTHTSLTVGIAEGKDFPDTDVVVANYDIVHKHHDRVRGIDWDLLICDEAHALQNPDSRRTQNVLGGGKGRKKVTQIPAKRRLFMTGTPMSSRPVNLWPIIKACDPNGLGADWMKFTRRYCAGFDSPWGYDTSGASHLEELQEKLRSSFMIRRLKSQVLTELPPKRRQIIELPADGLKKLLQWEIDTYTIHKILLDRVIGVEDIDYADHANQLTGPEVTVIEEMAALRQEVALAKLPMVFELIAGILDSGEKVVVFCYHRAVAAALQEKYPNAAVITGSVAQHKRQDAVDRFQNDPACTVFIGQITAAGAGHTLTAASKVVFSEINWDYASNAQAEDRVHRIGQTADSVNIYYPVLEGSLDAQMLKSYVEKEGNISKALN